MKFNLKHAIALYAIGGAATTLYWGNLAGGIGTAITGAPGQALQIFLTWPAYLYNLWQSQQSVNQASAG